ncbi:hypothetical protein [Nocardia sp. NPDC006630]|uniref:hypothetical protein n=1 Tax=Nocardia sp. NPDC006630 TaxID=3157181 RepID=UPI0033A847DF
MGEEFVDRSTSVAAVLDFVRGLEGAGSAAELPTGWEADFSRLARDLKGMIDQIQHLVDDHSQLAYQRRLAERRAHASGRLSKQ